MDLGIDGRVALVTGASKGLGRAIAAALAAEGARVAVASRSRERIDAAAMAIGAQGFVHDTGDASGASALVDAVEQTLGGPVEILVTNSGGPPSNADALAFTREQWEAAHRDLVLGPLALVERVLPGMRERGWGRVLAVSSGAVREPIPNLMLSNAYRTGLLAAFKTIARQVARDGVTVNSLVPGRILTDRIRELASGDEAALAAGAAAMPAGRFGTPAEFAAAAAFLCSAPASYITGVALPVDGGLLHGL